MKFRHLISLLLMMLVGCSALGVYFVWQYQLPSRVIARVDDIDIPQQELTLRLQALLWRQGKSWEQLNRAEQTSLQREATEALIDALLVNKWAATHPALVAKAQTEADFQQFLKQFESPSGWNERAALQGLNEPRLREMLAEETGQRAALEAYLARGSTVSEAVAQSWFNEHAQELLIPESVRVSHVFISGHDKTKPDRSAEIQAIYQQYLSRRSTFEELAEKFSEDERSKLKGGELGWLTRERVPGEFADKVFSMATDEVSTPFQSTLGWHIIRLQDRHAERLPQFVEVQQEISALLESRNREALLRELIQGLRQKALIIRNERLIQRTNPPLL
ncbi:peptidyl-prolyl cis-trans isomerase [soil metagenome]